MIVLIAQYLLGLWTNLYAPPAAAGFTSESSFSSLDWHYNLGYILGIVFAAFTRRLSLVVLAVLLFVAVLAAGLAGSAFVGTSPNPSNDSFVMGLMFLLAFAAGSGLAYMSRMRIPSPNSTMAGANPTSTGRHPNSGLTQSSPVKAEVE